MDGEPFGQPRRGLRKRIGSALAGVGALAAKFATTLKALFVALPNLKLLTTTGTALISVAAYSLFWGWEFAAGFVVLLFIHEMGHVIALRREGIPASAPMFVPFMGALITARSLGDNALAEARVGLAGPILGSARRGRRRRRRGAHPQRHADRARVCRLPDQPLQPPADRAARRWPRDGRDGAVDVVRRLRRTARDAVRAALQPDRADHRPVRRASRLYRRWQLRKTRSPEQEAYYRVAPHHRLLVGAVYIGLAAALAFGMAETHVLASAGHNFGRL